MLKEFSSEFVADWLAVLNLVWRNGGKTFGGTSRDLLRGDPLNDLDISLSNGGEIISGAFPRAKKTQKADRGLGYYDCRIVFPSGLSVDIVGGWVEVTDMDINLITISKTETKLLYVPAHLVTSINPLMEVLTNIRLKRFVPLRTECATHRQYRWDEFEKRGWKKL